MKLTICDAGGVLSKARTREAAVDIARLAGQGEAAVISTIVGDESGGLLALDDLKALAAEYKLPIVLVSDLIRYRRKREAIVERQAAARLPTSFGEFTIHSYKSVLDGVEHAALVHGDIGDGLGVLVRVHSECLTGDIFASRRCDCGPQLHASMERVVKEGRGVIIYLRGQEGRGIGLGHKLLAYNLQDQGRDTVDANVDLGLPVDSREYGMGAQMLADLGVKTIKLMTNNPTKFKGLRGHGLAVVSRVPLVTTVHDDNRRYIETKRDRMGHVYTVWTCGPSLTCSRAHFVVGAGYRRFARRHQAVDVYSFY